MSTDHTAIAIRGETRKPRLLSWVPVIALSAAVIVGLFEPLAAIPYRMSTGYNEGWNAFWSRAALNGSALYPSPNAAVANNYPPLSFYLVGVLGRMLGDNIIAGRIVSLASLLGITWLLFAWLRRAGTSRQVAAFGSGAFLAAMTGYAPGYIAFDDPQLLAHAVMLWGLVLVWRGQFSVRVVALSAVIMVSGGFIKHLLLPLPLATTIWIAIHRRDRLGVWLLAAAGTASALFIGSWMVFGADFFRDVFVGRSYDLPVALRETASACLHLAPMLALTAVATATAGRLESLAERDGAAFVAWYAALGAAVGVAASTGVGVNVNAFFDLLIACSLGVALGLEALDSESGSWPGASAVAGIVVVILGGLIAFRLPAEFLAISQLSRHERDTEEDIRILRDLGRGHAACEEPALCYWAGDRFEVDMSNFGQKLETGAVPASACEKVLGARSIAVIQLKSRAVIGSSRLPEICNQVIRRDFVPVHESSNGQILIRKRSSAGE